MRFSLRIAAAVSFLILFAAVPALGQSYEVGHWGLISLAGHEAIQKDLRFDEAQLEKLKTLSVEYYQTLKAESAEFGIAPIVIQDIPEEERQAKFRKIMSDMFNIWVKVQPQYVPRVAEILSAEQFKRLRQIDIQISGPKAFINAEVVQALAITAQQQDKITEIVNKLLQTQADLIVDEQRPFRERATKIREHNGIAQSQINEVLTEKQRSQFIEIKGKSFDVKRIQKEPVDRKKNVRLPRSANKQSEAK